MDYQSDVKGGPLIAIGAGDSTGSASITIEAPVILLSAIELGADAHVITGKYNVTAASPFGVAVPILKDIGDLSNYSKELADEPAKAEKDSQLKFVNKLVIVLTYSKPSAGTVQNIVWAVTYWTRRSK